MKHSKLSATQQEEQTAELRAAKTTAQWKSRKAGDRALRYIFPATRVLAPSPTR